MHDRLVFFRLAFLVKIGVKNTIGRVSEQKANVLQVSPSDTRKDFLSQCIILANSIYV